MTHSISEIQAKLADLGYLAAKAPDGTSNIDGVPGQLTFDAFNHYLAGRNRPPIVLKDFTLARMNADLWPEEQPPPKPLSNPLDNPIIRIGLGLLISTLKGYFPMLSFLDGFKTYIIGGIAILTGVAAMLGWGIPGLPVLSPADGWNLVLGGLAALGLRRAITTSAAK